MPFSKTCPDNKNLSVISNIQNILAKFIFCRQSKNKVLKIDSLKINIQLKNSPLECFLRELIKRNVAKAIALPLT